MKDSNNNVLYVGKALSLKNRVRQYFRDSGQLEQRILSMVGKISDLEIVITDTELEAFYLEYNLIKKYRPKYNILLKDDKSYSYIKITTNEEYPRIVMTRKIERDGARYFGPYLSAKKVKETLDFIRDIFPLRSCNIKVGSKNLNRPCLYYHINKCQGLCTGEVNKMDYALIVKQVCKFLEGKYAELTQDIRDRMFDAANNLEFELASLLKVKLEAIESVLSKQKIVSARNQESDVFAFLQNASVTYVQVLNIRSGSLTGSEKFILENTELSSVTDIMTAFVEQYYLSSAYIPKEVMLQSKIDDAQMLSNCLSQLKGGKVNIIVPKRGKSKELLDMAMHNAEHNLREYESSAEYQRDRTIGALNELSDTLGLIRFPDRIEAYDISNIQGTESVGSLVVFEAGYPLYNDYRRYKIKNLNNAPNDYASIAQIIERRFKRIIEVNKEQQATSDSTDRDKNNRLPDLIMVDGGRGQLNAALSVLKSLCVFDIPVIGLAKEFEEIYTENLDTPIIMSRNSKALQLLQRIRDEAHRFAVTYHRSLRKKTNLCSLLEEIPGIGKKRRMELFTHFGSIEAIKNANVDELQRVKGINKSIADSIYRYFH